MLLALPLVLSSYLVTVFVLIFFYAYLGQAWNIVGGYAGQLSAGHAAFVGVGAYTAAVLSLSAGLTPWVGMFVGGALAAVLGAFVGGLIVSVAESLGAVFLNPSMKELVSFALLVVILLVRPAGIFGRRTI